MGPPRLAPFLVRGWNPLHGRWWCSSSPASTGRERANSHRRRVFLRRTAFSRWKVHCRRFRRVREEGDLHPADSSTERPNARVRQRWPNSPLAPRWQGTLFRGSRLLHYGSRDQPRLDSQRRCSTSTFPYPRRHHRLRHPARWAALPDCHSVCCAPGQPDYRRSELVGRTEALVRHEKPTKSSTGETGRMNTVRVTVNPPHRSSDCEWKPSIYSRRASSRRYQLAQSASASSVQADRRHWRERRSAQHPHLAEMRAQRVRERRIGLRQQFDSERAER